MQDNLIVTFGQEDLARFLSSFDLPDYSSVKLDYDDDTIGAAFDLLENYDEIDITESQLKNLGSFVLRCIYANEENESILIETIDEIYEEKHTALLESRRTLSKKKKQIAEAMEMNKKFVTGDSFNELSPEAKRWHGKVRLLALKSFKASWFPGVKTRSDLISARNTEDQGDLLKHFNAPLFSVPETLFGNIKKSYEDFNPGLYEYIEYLMYKIEYVKRKENKGYSLNRTVFLVTDATNLNNVHPGSNLLAINTNGNARPTYKALPEFLTPDDLNKEKEQQTLTTKYKESRPVGDTSQFANSFMS